jgi:sugar O-acyltransferase (sialic acid O-acetyltransferase NeuD family)
MRTVIYGSRPDGQAKIVVELAAARQDLELVGLLDDFPENRGRTIAELSVIGTGSDLDDLRRSGVEALLIGFGESVGRARTVERAIAAELQLPNLVHETSVQYASATFGRGVQVFPLAHVGAGASLGDGVLVNTAASVEHDAVIETGAVILPGARLGGRVRVGRDATVGAGAIVLPDVTIGAEAVVGAGAVVLRDVPPGARVVGVPARPLPPREGAPSGS